jgi:siderophore synthetase component
MTHAPSHVSPLVPLRTPAPAAEPGDPHDLLDRLAAPLDPVRWRAINQRYLARAIGELLHERMIDAEVRDPGGGQPLALSISADDPAVRWTCRAVRRALDHWHVEPETVRREASGGAEHPDAAQLFLDLARTIGSDPSTLTHFLEETAQTLYADAWIAARGRPRAAALAEADHQTIEAAMEGHPWVLVNKGRLGFSATDTLRFAPEHGSPQRLYWLAARDDRAAFHALPGIEHDRFLDEQLGPETTAGFRGRLAAAGLSPAAYRFVPVSEWQWDHKIAIQMAADLSSRRLVALGAGPDLYRPQQSIRTYQHAADPRRCFVKTALSILNTFQIRGLDPRKLRLAPAMTAWLRDRLRGDAELERAGLVVLGEVAAVTYHHPHFAQLPRGPYQFREMLGALWRESAAPHLAPGESLMSMAALLYVDDTGEALVAALARRAGLPLAAWLERYLTAYLRPLLHCFYQHETFFVAHGENTILVLEDGAPVRVIFKDLVEEVQVSPRVRAGMPDDLRDLVYELGEELVPLHILTDVFDAFFRYLGDVLATHTSVTEAAFWGMVARTIRTYQADHPELADAFARIDLFRAGFPCYPLNKYRLVYHGYGEAADNVHDLTPRFAGELPNPIARARALAPGE